MVVRPNLSEEIAAWHAGYRHVAGLDEAGRGAWAGPIYAAAVILPPQPEEISSQLAGVRDSKTLSAAARERLIARIEAVALAVGVGAASAAEIDRVGIVSANRLAMHRALQQLALPADFLLVDYLPLPDIALPQHAFPHGEDVSLSVAAASIVAKVRRDRLMCTLDDDFPGYGFAQHKGYGTARHRQALIERGLTVQHRRSWAPMRDLSEAHHAP